jgi:murein DD-endopeptidase MepM/ murein hydrolase activator NlpD
MRRLLFVLVLAAGLAAVGGSTSSAAGLPSASVPNGPGMSLPPNWTTPPAVYERRTYDQLLSLWRSAGAAYNVPWQVLGAINKIESDFGRNMGPSSAGALGWMQFMPDTWLRWGTDGNGDGVASPWNPEDGIYSAARYLAAAGAASDISRAIFAYNHAQWYVDDVLELARLFDDGGSAVSEDLGSSLFAPGFPTAASGPQLVFAVDDIEKRIADARKRVSRARQAMVEVEQESDELGWAILDAERKAGDPALPDQKFAKLEATVARLTAERGGVAERLERLATRLDYEVTRLDELRKEAATTQAAITFTRPAGAAAAFGGAMTLGDYVFPVGGGAGVVSTSHSHHDYPAADIAAPEGSPVFALTDAVVTDAWPSATGRCGIGLQLRGQDGQDYVYCHLAYLEASVQPGAALAAGAPLGIVGMTGNTTGPHLHLQYSPTHSYPQDAAWFQSFAGRAFSWQDGERDHGTGGGPLFEVVDADVVTFTR